MTKRDFPCLGIIETDGLAAALEAADSMLKLGGVSLLDIRADVLMRVAVLVEGDLGCVQTAVEAGATAAARKGTVVGRNVIPRCHDALLRHLKAHAQQGRNDTVVHSATSPC
jgi:ethanolamine utilization protein EutM